jgi:hypothetical protein
MDPGWVKKSGSGSGIRDEQPGSYFLELRNHYFGLKYFNSLMRVRDGKNSDPGSMRIRDGKNSDPGWKNVGSGIENNIPDPQHWDKL